MADDIRVLTSLAGHPRLRKLERRLGFHEARSVLVFLWLRVRMDRPDGELRGWSAEDVAIACDWSGDPVQLVKDLTDCGWIDQAQDGCLSVHGWTRRQGYAAGSRSREAINRTNAIKRWLYRAGFTRTAVKSMSPDEIEAAWVALGRPDGDAGGCETDANGCDRIDEQCDSQCPLPAPSPTPSPIPIPIPIPSPIPGVTGGGGAPPGNLSRTPKEPEQKPPAPAHTPPERRAVAILDRLRSCLDPRWARPTSNIRDREAVMQALEDPAKADILDQAVDRLLAEGVPKWCSGRMGLASFLKQPERFASGELTGGGPEAEQRGAKPIGLAAGKKFLEDQAAYDAAKAAASQDPHAETRKNLHLLGLLPKGESDGDA